MSPPPASPQPPSRFTLPPRTPPRPTPAPRRLVRSRCQGRTSERQMKGCSAAAVISPGAYPRCSPCLSQGGALWVLTQTRLRSCSLSVSWVGLGVGGGRGKQGGGGGGALLCAGGGALWGLIQPRLRSSFLSVGCRGWVAAEMRGLLRAGGARFRCVWKAVPTRKSLCWAG